MKKLTSIAALFVLACAGCGQSTDTPSTKQADQAVAPTATAAPAEASAAKSGRLKPEMLITFPKAGFACMTKEGLYNAIKYAANGEATKLSAMMVGSKSDHGECLLLDKTKRYKTLSAEYEGDGSELGVLEIVGEGSDADRGAFALTIGAVPAPAN